MQLIAKNYEAIKMQEVQDDLYISYQTALLTAAFVCDDLNGEKNPSFNELYPNLLSDDDKEKIMKEEARVYKEKLKAFMNMHNKNRKEGK